MLSLCLLLLSVTWACRCSTASQAKLDSSPSGKQVAKTASTGKLIVKEDQEVRQSSEQAAGSEGVQDMGLWPPVLLRQCPLRSADLAARGDNPN